MSMRSLGLNGLKNEEVDKNLPVDSMAKTPGQNKLRDVYAGFLCLFIYFSCVAKFSDEKMKLDWMQSFGRVWTLVLVT